MSGILERTLVLGKVKLSGKRDRFVPFPWDLVGSGPASGWEPAEGQPMGRVADVNRLRHKESPSLLASHITSMDYATPWFYDNGTLIHGGYVNIV